LLGGDRGEVVDGFVRTLGVEPRDPVQDRWLEVVPVAPGTVRMEQLGLEQADLRFGQGIVVSIADRADRRVNAGPGQPAGERNRRILRPRVRIKPNSA
jgi:hypothetical protein